MKRRPATCIPNIESACQKRLFNLRVRNLHKVQEYEIPESKLTYSDSENQSLESSLEVTFAVSESPRMIDRLKFKNALQALNWYVKFKSSCRCTPRNIREFQSYDDGVCIATDISNILDRRFSENDRQLLLSCGIYGFEETLKKMREPEVGNNKRFLRSRLLRMGGYLKDAYYIEFDSQGQKVAY